jgi:hypothetical protein
LDKINKARNSTYKLIQSFNVDPAIVDKNISKIIEIFTKTTYVFENNPCLKLKEEEMDRRKNCFADITSQILIDFINYDIIIGETAYFNKGSVVNSSIVGYEFYLGPLFFQVYQKKC